MTAWESDDGAPITELMDDIFHALARLDYRDSRRMREENGTISV